MVVGKGAGGVWLWCWIEIVMMYFDYGDWSRWCWCMVTRSDGGGLWW